MKAMQLQRIAPIEESPLRLVDVEAPRPGEGQVRVAVRTCALCRTDLHVIEGDLPQPQLPLIPGHQVVGVVDALGPGCGRVREGQRVGIAWLGHTCGQCEYCTGGRENLCQHQRFTGYHADGGYAEFALAREDFVYEIPDGFDDVAAAPLLCAGIVGYRAFRRSRPVDGGTLAIYGFGSSAHVILPIALHRGITVYVVTRTPSHQRLAREMGAAWAGDDAAQMPARVDSAILFAPAGRLVPPALEQLKPGGTLSLAGVTMTPIPQLDYERHVFHERDICSVTANTRQDGRDLMAEAVEAGVRPHTTVYPLAEANRGLQDLKAGRIDGSGVLRIAES